MRQCHRRSYTCGGQSNRSYSSCRISSWNLNCNTFTCILLLDFVNTLEPPDGHHNGFKQFIVSDAGAKVLQALNKVLFGDLFSPDPIQVLDVQKRLIEFFYNILLEATSALDVGMGSGAEYLFHVVESRMGLAR